MNAQEIFDTVSKHIFAQGKRATNSLVCLYRGENVKCAVGVLLSDDIYLPEMDKGNYHIRCLVKFFPARFPIWFTTNIDLISMLQSVHDKQDNWESSSKMRLALTRVGAHFKLNLSIISSLQFHHSTEHILDESANNG